MSRLPAEMIEILREEERHREKREHILNLVHWRLSRGKPFSVGEIVAAARIRTSSRYVSRLADSLERAGLVSRLPCGAYGASSGNQGACQAMVLSFARKTGSFRRKDVRLGVPSAIDDNTIDRIMRDLIAERRLEKIGHGRYRTCDGVMEAV